MGVFEQFPYANMHEMNLEWLLKKMKELAKAMEIFKATESLKFADPIIWNITTQYEKSTIVLDPAGNAYLSLQAVPAGVQLNNDEYWLEIFNFTDYTRTANQNLTVNTETNTTRATAEYTVDDWLIWNDVLYKVTSDITIDDALIVSPEAGSNIIHFTVEDFCRTWQTYLTNLVEQYKSDIDASELQYKNDIDASELAYRQQLASDIANTTASLQAQLNAAIAGATVDSEIINARVGADGITYATLGNAIRGQLIEIKNILHRFNVCKNLIGNTVGEIYPVLIPQGTRFMISTSDGDPLGANCQIDIYDENGTFRSYVTLSAEMSSREHHNDNYAIYGLALHNAPRVPLQIEIGTAVTDYVPYYYSTYSLNAIINDLTSFINTHISDLTEFADNQLPTSNLDIFGTPTAAGNTTSLVRDDGAYLATYAGSDNLASPSLNVGLIVPIGILTNDVFIEVNANAYWGDGTQFDPTIYVFVGTSFNYSYGYHIGNKVKGNLKEATEAVNSNNAKLYIAFGTYGITDTDHIYQTADGWHVDPMTLRINIKLSNNVGVDEYITCWGDSLTAMGGWSDTLASLANLPFNNEGVSAEMMKDIICRQGADHLLVNDVTIPAGGTPVQIGSTLGAGGIKSFFGNNCTPILSSDRGFNPCYIGNIKGTFRWTGQSMSDQNGTWTFSRSSNGTAEVIDVERGIRTYADMNCNAPVLMTILMGQNDYGFNNNDNNFHRVITEEQIATTINYCRLMIEHADAKHFIILGIATGDETSNGNYDEAMDQEFGLNYISIRKLLAHPIYSGSDIVSCYGLRYLEITPDETDLTHIADGRVPRDCFMDGVHFTVSIRPFIGEYIYKRCIDLNIFK